MTYRSPARYLALLALLGAAFAVYLVVQSGTSGEEPTSAGTTTATTTRTTATRRTPARRSYTVRPGDTLSGIAERTGVPLTRLQRLNPDVDVNTLNTGQRLKLRPSS